MLARTHCSWRMVRSEEEIIQNFGNWFYNFILISQNSWSKKRNESEEEQICSNFSVSLSRIFYIAWVENIEIQFSFQATTQLICRYLLLKKCLTRAKMLWRCESRNGLKSLELWCQEEWISSPRIYIICYDWYIHYKGNSKLESNKSVNFHDKLLFSSINYKYKVQL